MPDELLTGTAKHCSNHLESTENPHRVLEYLARGCGWRMSPPSPGIAVPAMRTGTTCRREKELLDNTEEDFEERWMLKGAQKAKDSLSGWRETGGGGPSQRGQDTQEG